jgi:hypothetical protein
METSERGRSKIGEKMKIRKEKVEEEGGGRMEETQRITQKSKPISALQEGVSRFTWV